VGDIDLVDFVPVAVDLAENHATPRLLVDPCNRKSVEFRVAAKVEADRITDCNPVGQAHVLIGFTGRYDNPATAFCQYPEVAGMTA